MWENKNMPKFGCLQGVKIIHSTASTAGPVGVQLLADQGADVIWLENAKAYDLSRYAGSASMDGDRRNQRTLALDIPSPEGRKIFLELVKGADVFVEASKGGQYDKWGLSDEALWEVNPKLVIAHLSGYGQTGLPEYVNRPSFDAVAQAFSGYTYQNMNPVTPPYAVGPYAADYASAAFIAMSVAIALYKVATTGVGESIDLAQYEIMMRVEQYATDLLSGNEVRSEKAGDPVQNAGIGTYICKDGGYIASCFVGAGVFKKCCEFFGLEYGTDVFPVGTAMVSKRTRPEAAKIFDDAMSNFCLSKDSIEAEAEMLAAGLPVSRVNCIADLADNPHVKARESLVSYENNKGYTITSVAPTPKFKKAPGKIWRCSPYAGMDNEEILAELGYNEDQIKSLYEQKVISKDTNMMGVFSKKK